MARSDAGRRGRAGGGLPADAWGALTGFETHLCYK